MSEQDDLAANAYAELVHTIEKRGAISSVRVKTIVMGHLGLQRLRRQRIDPILQRGVDAGIWDWVETDERAPFNLVLAEERDEELDVSRSEEQDEYETLPEAGDWNSAKEKKEQALTAALKRAGILPEEEEATLTVKRVAFTPEPPEGEEEITYSTGTKAPVYESDCRECALPVPKGCTFCSPSCEAEYNHKATLEVEFEGVEEEEEGPAYTLLKDRKGILDYTLREVLDAILEHIGSK